MVQAGLRPLKPSIVIFFRSNVSIFSVWWLLILGVRISGLLWSRGVVASPTGLFTLLFVLPRGMVAMRP